MELDQMVFRFMKDCETLGECQKELNINSESFYFSEMITWNVFSLSFMSLIALISAVLS